MQWRWLKDLLARGLGDRARRAIGSRTMSPG
jgi:hypothetical protein